MALVAVAAADTLDRALSFTRFAQPGKGSSCSLDQSLGRACVQQCVVQVFGPQRFSGPKRHTGKPGDGKNPASTTTAKQATIHIRTKATVKLRDISKSSILRMGSNTTATQLNNNILATKYSNNILATKYSNNILLTHLSSSTLVMNLRHVVQGSLLNSITSAMHRHQPLQHVTG